LALYDQLGNEASLLTSLRTGAVYMCINSEGSTSALVPEVAAVSLPLLFDPRSAAFKLLGGAFCNGLAERFARVSISALGWWDNGIATFPTLHAQSTRQNTGRDLPAEIVRRPSAIGVA
jgi:TRAP-type C4-dicarboxylate transport system substrate-binding protein